MFSNLGCALDAKEGIGIGAICCLSMSNTDVFNFIK